MTPSIDSLMMDYNSNNSSGGTAATAATDIAAANASMSTKKRKRLQPSMDEADGIDVDVDVDIEEEMRQLEFSIRSEHQLHRLRFLLRQHYDCLVPPRLQFSYWKQLSKTIKEEISMAIQDIRGPGLLRFLKLDASDLPVFECNLCNTSNSSCCSISRRSSSSLSCDRLQLILIPGGSYNIGLSEKSEEQLWTFLEETFQMPFMDISENNNQGDGLSFQNTSRMRPTQSISIQPFLLATKPMDCCRRRRRHSSSSSSTTNLNMNMNMNTMADSSFHNNFQRIQQVLNDNYHLRLPSEAEWEYAARSGGWDLLFPYHYTIPTKMDSNQYQHESSKNAFGLYGLGYVLEVCADIWHDNLEGLPLDGSARKHSSSLRVSSGVTTSIATSNGLRVGHHHQHQQQQQHHPSSIKQQHVLRGGDISSWNDKNDWSQMLLYRRNPSNVHGSGKPPSLRFAMDIV